MDRLVELALKGTNRTDEQGLLNEQPVGALVTQTPATTPAKQLLLAAGGYAIYRQAGQQLPSIASSFTTAPEDEMPPCSPNIARLLDELFSGDKGALVILALSRLARAGQRLPHHLLPQALEYGTQYHAVREGLLPTLDQRGRWLARMNHSWRWIEETAAALDTTSEIPVNAEEQWQAGQPYERVYILRQVRTADPDKARAWVEATWKTEKADFRLQMLKTFASQLSIEDDPFLDATLDDRSQAVRQEAITLLSRIPNSALQQRMQERANQLLHYLPPQQTGLLQKLARTATKQAPIGTLQVTLPENLDRQWKRDLVDSKPPKGIGERAWWLERTLACVAPSHWSTQFAATPAELIAAASGHEWGSTLLKGWAQAATIAADIQWASALWQFWSKPEYIKENHENVYSSEKSALVSLLPPAECEAIVSRLIGNSLKEEYLVWMNLIDQIPTPWNEQFGQQYLEATRKRATIRTKEYFDPWIDTLERAVYALPPTLFAEARKPWEVKNKSVWLTNKWEDAIKEFISTLEKRQQIMEEIPV